MRDSAQRPLDGEKSMNDGAYRHDAEARLIDVSFVVETGQRLDAGPSGRILGPAVAADARRADACGRGEGKNRKPGKTSAERDRGPGRDREDPTRNRKD